MTGFALPSVVTGDARRPNPERLDSAQECRQSVMEWHSCTFHSTMTGCGSIARCYEPPLVLVGGCNRCGNRRRCDAMRLSYVLSGALTFVAVAPCSLLLSLFWLCLVWHRSRPRDVFAVSSPPADGGCVTVAIVVVGLLWSVLWPVNALSAAAKGRMHWDNLTFFKQFLH